jgi:lipoate---protein ligase
MLFIDSESDDPFFNLALEELLLRNSGDDYLIICVNYPSVIIGKHQSAHIEVDTKFVTENNIPVIRRISGGGTVYQDLGNLNFTFIRSSEPGKQVDFIKYTQPVVNFLSSLGVDVRFEGKSDLKVDGLKISGNAEHVFRERILHHGTLLFDASAEMLGSSLRKDTSSYRSRAVRSNPSAVTNLRHKLPFFRSTGEFKAAMTVHFRNEFPGMTDHVLTDPERSEAIMLAGSKYRTWEWNYAYGPEYTFNNRFVAAGTVHSCSLVVSEGKIRECVIEGSDRMSSAAKKLLGCRHMVQDIIELFKRHNIFETEEEIYNFF